MCLLMAGCGKAATATEQPDTTALAPTGTEAPAVPTDPTEPVGDENTEPNEEMMDPTQPPVQLVMPEYELTYAGEYAQVITWEETQEEAGLQFYVELSVGKVPLFTLLLDQISGEFVEMKENAAGEKIPISFVMESQPEGLSEEDMQVFSGAQDIVNDIARSLVLK